MHLLLNILTAYVKKNNVIHIVKTSKSSNVVGYDNNPEHRFELKQKVWAYPAFIYF